jgi:hypothetical protein
MKKSFFFGLGLVAAGFIGFSAFSDDTMTDAQKIAKSLETKIATFKVDQAAACRANAMEVARTNADTMIAAAKASMEAQAKKGVKRPVPPKLKPAVAKPAINPPVKEVVDPKKDKMTGQDAARNVEEKKDKITGQDAKANTDAKKSKMGGGK